MRLNMAKSTDSIADDKGLSARNLILVFLGGVAVCGVFFSLGFLVGYNERSARMAPVTERVPTPATIPPTVNTPLETAPVGAGGAAPSTTSIPPPLAPQQASAPASASSEQKPVAVPGIASPVTAPPPSAAKAEREPAPGAAATPPAGAGEVGVGITVQVAASRSKQDAEALVKILEERGYPVFLVTPEYERANDNLYRVQVGPFRSKDDAEKVRTKLTQEGFKPFIKH
jgi:cell division septation protein DedD